jgi:putative addiction module component (TIGR02574 family)
MKQLPDDVLRAALALPPEARAALAGRLIASLDEVDEDAERAWSDEIARRVAELERGAVTCIPWPEARRRIVG